MSWNSNLRRGTDLTTWDWLSFVPDGSTYPGSCIAYDGVRYIYCLNQNGTTTGSTTTGSTANFFKYDTWSDAWHKIAASVPSTGAGGDIEYDPVRNVLWTIHGAATTTMYGFNLNNANVLANGNTQVQTTSMAPYTHVSITGTFPATPAMGSSMALVEDVSYEAPFATGTVAQGISTTSWLEPLYPTLINPAHAGCALRFTTGTAANVSGTFPNIRRTIYGTNPSYGVQPVLQTYSSGGAPTATTFVVGSATGIVAGMYVSGTGIPTGSYVTTVSGTTITISQTIAVQVAGTIAFHPYRPLTTTYTGTSGQYTIVVASASGIGLGMPVAGTGIATGAVVAAISGTTITLSLPNTSSQTTIACGFFSDGAIYTPISGSASSTTITVGSANFLSVGMTVTGTGIFPNTYITNISGTTITLSNATTTAVFGTGTFTANFMQVVLATALPSTPAYGDAYSVDFPQGTSSGTNTSSTLNDTTQNWTANIYRDSDIVITAGTGVGQRRRILSHTTTAITIGVGTAGTAQAGNDRTGGWAVTPDATSQYKIVPSSDFIYVYPQS